MEQRVGTSRIMTDMAGVKDDMAGIPSDMDGVKKDTSPGPYVYLAPEGSVTLWVHRREKI